MSVGDVDHDLPLVWMAGEIKTPPFSIEARIESGALLRQLQSGRSIGMPRSRPMPSIGARCHELRVVDQNRTWRIFYHIDPGSAVVVLGVLAKKTPKSPPQVIEVCGDLLASYYRGKQGGG